MANWNQSRVPSGHPNCTSSLLCKDTASFNELRVLERDAEFYLARKSWNVAIIIVASSIWHGRSTPVNVATVLGAEERGQIPPYV